MSDDTRQARIAAAMDQLFQGERGDVALGYYTVRSRMDAALKAADAIGRERVSEDEAISWLAIYRQTVIDVYLKGGGIAASDLAEYNRHLIALLTAAPAERGHDETGDQP